MAFPDDGHCKLLLCEDMSRQCKDCQFYIPEEKDRKPNKEWLALHSKPIGEEMADAFDKIVEKTGL